MFLSKDTPSDIVSAEFVIQARNPMGIHQQSTSLLADIANQRRRLIAARIAIGEALASPACRLNVQALDKGAIVAAMPTTSKRISRNTVRTAARSRDHLPEPGYASIGSEGGTLMPSKQQAASSKQQAASSKQQAASSKQQAASSKQQAASLGRKPSAVQGKERQAGRILYAAYISNELKHYKAQLRDKTVLCNCDDPYESNFFKYLALNFNTLGLKKLIVTSYVKSPIVGGQLSLLDIAGLKPEGKEPYAIEINNVPDHKRRGTTDITDVKYLLKHDANTAWTLKGDGAYNGGDFRSRECVDLLKRADVVITNPPFSLFREYVAQLAAHNKNFLIIGSKNAIDYRGVFELIRTNRLWLGHGFASGNAYFKIPHELAREFANGVYDPHTGLVKFRNVGWFTNLDYESRHEKIPLYKKYSPAEYPTYDNYDAIEVSKVAEIPADYDDAMGVPVTFLDKYNPEQFEILGMCENKDLFGLKTKVFTTKECQEAYFKLFGKRGTYDLNAAGVIAGRKVYKRLLIRRKS